MSAPAASSSSSASSAAAAAALSPATHDDEQSTHGNMTRQSTGEKQQEQAASCERTESQEPSNQRARLHRHVLESIFACLDLAGLATAMRVSRDWQAAVGCMRSIGGSLVLNDGSLLSQVAASRLRRHVSELLGDLTPELLALMHERMSHITKLTVFGLPLPRGLASLTLPPSLQELTINTGAKAEETNMMLRAIGQLEQLCVLTLELRHDASLTFAPLASLPLLRVLRLDWDEDSDVTDTQVDECRALVGLNKFKMCMDSALMMRMLRQPHALRWQQFSVMPQHDEAACALLPGLSCLTKISMRESLSLRFDWLPRILHLQDLTVELSLDHGMASDAMLSLLAALHQCPRISTLRISAPDVFLTADMLASCLACMPELSTLDIDSASLPSLAFLSSPSLALSLQELSLGRLTDPRPALNDLQYVHGLQSLRRLTLVDAFEDPLDDESRAALQPPSLMMPRLEEATFEDVME